MSEACLNEATPAGTHQSLYVATAAEAMRNYARNEARTWYKEAADPNDSAGNYAFQRLKRTWFTPQLHPKFKFRRDDKFYAIGSCFARGLEHALAKYDLAVESAAPEFAKLQPANKEVSGLGFINKYNTYSIMSELCWALRGDRLGLWSALSDDGRFGRGEWRGLQSAAIGDRWPCIASFGLYELGRKGCGLSFAGIASS